MPKPLLSAPPFRHRHDREILHLAVPTFFALIAEPLLLLTDTAIVGTLGTRALGGLGIAGQVLMTLANLCIFLAYGTTAAVARRFGAGDVRSGLRSGIDGLWLALLIGAAVAAVGIPLSPWMVDVLGDTPDVAPYAVAADRDGRDRGAARAAERAHPAGRLGGDVRRQRRALRAAGARARPGHRRVGLGHGGRAGRRGGGLRRGGGPRGAPGGRAAG